MKSSQVKQKIMLQILIALVRKKTVTRTWLSLLDLDNLLRLGLKLQALTEQVLDGSLGVYIPYIFAEWAPISVNIAG